MKANDERKKLVELSRSLKDQFRNEIMLEQSLNIDLIKNFVFANEEMEHRSHASTKLL